MEALILFGLLAIMAMRVFYALEGCSPWLILGQHHTRPTCCCWRGVKNSATASRLKIPTRKNNQIAGSWLRNECITSIKALAAGNPDRGKARLSAPG